MNTMSSRSLALCAAAVWLLAGCFPEDPVIPEPDTCEQPSTTAVDSLELGSATLDEVFVPWLDGDTVTLAFGDQGGAMLPLRIRVGSAERSCVYQNITITDAASVVLVDLVYPMQLYQQADGSWVSDTNFAIFDLPPQADSLLTVTVTIGTQVTERTIQVGW